MPSLALLILLAAFTLSDVLFLMRASATPGLAVGLSALLIGAVVFLFRGVRQEALSPRWIAGLLLSAFLLCLIGGAGHLMYINEDWQVRDAVLHDLMRAGWPIIYPGPDAHILRAPVGFYLLPAAVGSALGVTAAHLGVLLQNSLMFGAVLMLWAREFNSTRTRLVGLTAITLFSGWDILGYGVRSLATGLHDGAADFTLHIERWGGFEYSSFLTDLYWAPNHGLPALAFAAVYLAWRRGEVSAPALALFAGLGLLWSPLAVMGMTPFVLYALVRDLRERRLQFIPFLVGAAAGAAVLPMLIYLQLDSGHVVNEWQLSNPDFVLAYLLLLVIEIGPLLYLLLRPGFGETGASRAELAIVVGMLLLIPIYKIGPSNDFGMRASIVPLVLLGVFVVHRLVSSLELGRSGVVRLMTVVLAIGAVTPSLQILRGFLHPRSEPITTPVPQAWAESVYRQQPMDTYLARPSSLAPFRALLKGADQPGAAMARNP